MKSSKWRKILLGDIIDSISIKHKFDKESLIFLNTSDVLDGKVLNKNYMKVKEMPGQAKKSIMKGDILFSEIRPKNKRFAYVDFNSDDYVVSTKLMVLRKKSNIIDNRYLYKYLTSDKMLNYLQMIAEGRSGTFPQITFNELKNLSLNLPSLEEQKAIAKILSDLDEKIEVNNKINKNLEEMAQAIFKQWFVDFEFPNEEGKPYKSSGGEMVESELGMIPKGFKVKSIGELPLIITDYVANGSFKSLKENVNMYDEINYAIIVRNTDLKSNFKSDCKYVDKKSYDFLAKSKLFGGELIISNVGDVGSIYLCPKFKKQMTLGSNLIMIDTESSENIGFNLILYRFFKSYIGQYYIKSITGGSAQPKFNKTDFKKIQFINPSNSILKLYNEKNEVIESIIMNNVLENERLEKLRDTLLPKLMSGEIRVPLENSEN